MKQGFEFFAPHVSQLPIFYAFLQLCESSLQGVEATKQVLCVGKDRQNGLHIGIPAIGDDGFGSIAQGFDLQQERSTIRRRVLREKRHVQRKARDMIDGHEEIPPHPFDLDPLLVHTKDARTLSGRFCR